MKKLAFFLALFVGLNASPIARKPEEEANEIIVAKDASRHSTAEWIQRIAHRLKACYYGITKEGLIHELGYGIMQKIKYTNSDNKQIINPQLETYDTLLNKQKREPVWINFSHGFENGIECYKVNVLIKKNGEWKHFERSI